MTICLLVQSAAKWRQTQGRGCAKLRFGQKNVPVRRSIGSSATSTFLLTNMLNCMTACSLLIGFSFVGKWVATLLVAVVPIVPVRVTTGSGETIEAQLRGLTDTTLLLSTVEGRRDLHFDEVVSLEQIEPPEKPEPAFKVTLLGGSRISAQDLSLDGETLLIEPRRQRLIRAKVKDVKSVRFRRSSVNTDPQWLGLLEEQGRGDVLVIRREGDRMDPYRGVIQSIADKKVSFDTNGNVISAPIEKLEGLIFGGGRAVSSKAKIQVTDIYGSQWLASKVLPGEDTDPLRLQLDGPIVHEVPLGDITVDSMDQRTTIAGSIGTSGPILQSFL